LPKRAITSKILILEDPTDTLKYNHLSKKDIIERFKNIPKDEVHIDFGKNSFWLHFVVRNDYNFNETYFLEIDNSTADIVQLYSASPDFTKISNQTGDATPFDSREIFHDNFIFELSIDANSHRDYFIHIQSNGNALNFPIYLHKPSSLIKESNNKFLLNGIFIGLIIAIALASFFTLLVNIKEKNYYFFVLYTIIGGIWILNLEGFCYQYFWSNSPTFNGLMNVILPELGCYFLARFAIGFLNVKKHNPFLHNSIAISSNSILLIIFILFLGFFNYSTLVTISLVIMIAVSIHVLLTAMFLLHVTPRNASFFLIAYTPFIIGVIWLILNVYFGISSIEVREFVIKISLLSQVIILHYGITDKIKKQRDQFEGALKESEEKHRRILENTVESIFVFEGHKIRYYNDHFLQLTGLTKKDIELSSYFETNYVDESKSIENFLNSITDSEKLKNTKTLNIINKKNEECWIELNSVEVPWGGKKALLIFMHDITLKMKAEKEREKLELQLWHSQKMETIGTLAGGIAHDFNNILTPILGYAELALESLDEKNEIWEDLKSIEESAIRAKELIKQMLSFSRQIDNSNKPVKLSDSFKELNNFLKASLPSSVNFSIQNHIRNNVVFIDPTNLNQILINVTTNAFQSLVNGKGNIVIKAEIINGSTLKDRNKEIKSIKYAQISVTDNGTGMDESVLNRIFEPFYTTKEIGKGTGLGLSVVHGIVVNNGGAIFVDSEIGKGSTFSILLPAFTEDREIQQESKPEPIHRGDEKILLVDDEYIVSATIKKMLIKLGYKVSVMNDSAKALRVIEDFPHKYDLVISDITMPEITGIDIAYRAHEANPKLKIILVTGLLNADELKMSLPKFCYIIKKPFDLKDLSSRIRQILDEKEEE